MGFKLETDPLAAPPFPTHRVTHHLEATMGEHSKEYQKGYDARQDGEPMNHSKSSDWQCGWWAAEHEIG